jgi:hypothetical protein
LGVGFGVGFGVASGVGEGGGGGSVTVTFGPAIRSLNFPSLSSDVKATVCVPTVSLPDHVNATGRFQFEPVAVMACEVWSMRTLTRSGAVPSEWF